MEDTETKRKVNRKLEFGEEGGVGLGIDMGLGSERGSDDGLNQGRWVAGNVGRVKLITNTRRWSKGNQSSMLVSFCLVWSRIVFLGRGRGCLIWFISVSFVYFYFSKSHFRKQQKISSHVDILICIPLISLHFSKPYRTSLSWKFESKERGKVFSHSMDLTFFHDAFFCGLDEHDGTRHLENRRDE